MVDIKRTPILIFVLVLFVGAAQAETLVVPAGGDVQAAVNAAKPGDTIILEAGAGYIGPLTLPNKTGMAFITIQSSALTLLPAGRITPAHSALLPKLYTPGSNFAALQTAPSAHHYRFIGIEFAPINANVVVSDLIKLGDGSVAQNSLDLVPHHLVLDRVYVHGYPTQELKRGIALNSANTDIINSYISDVHGIGYDTQAICGWNGPGPFRIINNYLEAAGENLMFGGDDARIEALTPADVEIRQNFFFKPLTWQVGHPTYAGKHWTIKNLLETKNVRRILIDGNMFENNWPDAQVGFAILIKSNNQEGTNPWAATLDLSYTNNTVKNSTHGLNIMGIENPPKVSAVSARLRFANNLWLISGIFLQGFQGAEDVILDHNTVISKGNGASMSLYSTPAKGFVVTNNIIPHTGYGVKGDGVGEGVASLAKFAPGYVFRRNLMPGARVSPDGPMDWPAVYPTDNYYPESLDGVFVDLAGGNYRIASPLYKTAGTDGKALGCDVDQLLAAQGGGVVSIPTPTPTPSPSPTPLPSPSPTASPSPTPTPVETPTPLPSPTATPIPSPSPIGKKCKWWPPNKWFSCL